MDLGKGFPLFHVTQEAWKELGAYGHHLSIHKGLLADNRARIDVHAYISSKFVWIENFSAFHFHTIYFLATNFLYCFVVARCYMEKGARCSRPVTECAVTEQRMELVNWRRHKVGGS